jgi:hypothetical protein
MSKIDKKKLTRGTKLGVEHVWDNNLDQVITNINSANASGGDGLIQPQYETGNGTFTITWNLPKLTSRWTRVNGPSREIYDNSVDPPIVTQNSDPGVPYIIPFVMPPLQEFMSFAGSTDQNTPQIYLTEFSFGFDQRGEPALPTDDTCGPGVNPAPSGAGASQLTWEKYVRLNEPFISVGRDHLVWVTNKNHGKLHYNIETRGPLKFELLAKDPLYFNANAGQVLTDSLYNLEVPMSAFIGKNLRLNPGFEKNLSIYMDPYRTYALAITPPQLHDPDTSANTTQDNLALVNLTITMKFRHKLVNRDVTGPDTIIAQPSEHGGAKTQNTVTVSKPAANTTIEADTADGLNTTISTIDKVFHDKLRSGYDTLSQPPPVEELCQDASYDIIAIPLWNNQMGNVVTFRDGVFGNMPYHSGGLVTAGTYDISDTDGPMTRAIVPIDYPFTIHHAFLAMNQFTCNYQPNGNTALGGASNPLQRHMCWEAWDSFNQAPSPGRGPNPIDIAPKTEIGVGVGTGRRTTQYGYRQVLHYDNLKLNDYTDTLYQFDQINMNYPVQTVGAPAFGDVPNWSIYNLPLNGQAGAGAGVSSGFFDTSGNAVGTLADQIVAQDSPHFCGQSWLARDKDTLATHPMTSASTTGTTKRYINSSGGNTGIYHDQWIEVRWKTILETNAGAPVGWSTVGEYGSAGGGAKVDDAKILHGVGGHWLYLVVKKTVVSGATLQNINAQGGM